jgi:hypothetical protein
LYRVLIFHCLTLLSFQELIMLPYWPLFSIYGVWLINFSILWVANVLRIDLVFSFCRIIVHSSYEVSIFRGLTHGARCHFCLYHLPHRHFCKYVLNNLYCQMLLEDLCTYYWVSVTSLIKKHKSSVVNLFLLHICLLLIWFLFIKVV